MKGNHSEVELERKGAHRLETVSFPSPSKKSEQYQLASIRAGVWACQTTCKLIRDPLMGLVFRDRVFAFMIQSRPNVSPSVYTLPSILSAITAGQGVQDLSRTRTTAHLSLVLPKRHIRTASRLGLAWLEHLCFGLLSHAIHDHDLLHEIL